jgi:hypothetical protein
MNGSDGFRSGWLALPFAAGLTFALLFVLVMTTALWAPRPHDIPVGLVAPEPAAARVWSALAARAPGAFSVHRYDSQARAEQAIDDREVYGAFVVDRQGAHLLLASAAGVAATAVIKSAFVGAAAAAHLPLTVQDLRPLPPGDPNGSLPFLLLLPLILASILASVLGAIIAGSRLVPVRLGLMVAYSAAVGLGATVVVQLVTGALGDVTRLGGVFWEVAGVTSLFVLALAGTITCLHRWLGMAGVALAVGVLLLLGVPTSGAFANYEFLPDVYRWLSQLLPPGAAVTALRSVLWFGGAAVAWPLMVLGLWAGGSLLLILLRQAVQALPVPARLHRRPRPAS